jgi:putative oxidoreductase
MKTSMINIARILFAIPFLIFGAMHLLYAKAMVAVVPAFIPGGILWVYLTGIVLVVTALSFITNIQIKIAGYCLAGMLLVFILTIHIPGIVSKNPVIVRWSMLALLKDFCLAAAAIFISATETMKKLE